MNRLQKKCVIVTAGIHLLLIVILFVGPAFFSPKPKADNWQVLDVIPANLIDAPFNSGVANAQPPPPAPVTPPAPAPEKIEQPKPVKETVKAPTPVEKPDVNQPRKVQISTQLVARTTPKNSPTTDNSQQQQQQARAIRSALRNLKSNLTPGTTIDMPGNSSAAYADYGQAVKSIYDQAWSLPANIASDDESVIVNVTIASDGTVVSARIVTPSGDANVDASVRRTLERVKFIAPFPNGALAKERSYTINFNPKAKRILE
jgi:TonB family protein